MWLLFFFFFTPKYLCCLYISMSKLVHDFCLDCRQRVRFCWFCRCNHGNHLDLTMQRLLIGLTSDNQNVSYISYCCTLFWTNFNLSLFSFLFFFYEKIITDWLVGMLEKEKAEQRQQGRRFWGKTVRFPSFRLDILNMFSFSFLVFNFHTFMSLCLLS